jgi:hypothetical protein
LQQNIIAKSTDESIFTWTDSGDYELRGMLAEWPTLFANSGNISRADDMLSERPPYVLTHKGLQFHASVPLWDGLFGPCWLLPTRLR